MIEELSYLRSACRTCVYGFPAANGFSCGITAKPTNAVVVRCEAYKESFEARRAGGRRAE